MTKSDAYAPLLLILSAAMLLACCGGCATTDESDMPWATPASWEGSAQIPGFSGQ
jgi:hypothetical protein